MDEHIRSLLLKRSEDELYRDSNFINEELSSRKRMRIEEGKQIAIQCAENTNNKKLEAIRTEDIMKQIISYICPNAKRNERVQQYDQEIRALACGVL